MTDDALAALLKDRLPFCPAGVDAKIDWPFIERELADWIAPMRTQTQDPIWHAEGTVWTHVTMVCEALVASDDWKSRPLKERMILFAAALLHDVGKPLCTKTENGRITSPQHAKTGATLARKLLWQRLGMTGTRELIEIRERILSLIRQHSLPYNILRRDDPLRDVITASHLSGCDMHATLSEADVRGRISEHKHESLEHVEFFRQFARENDCFASPFPFASKHSRYAYFAKRLDEARGRLYDDSWGEVVLMSGFPAAGKDTYIREHCRDMAVVSLDAIREQLGITWRDDQTPVAEAARNQARQLLRRKIPFVWNATNLRRDFRRTVIRLCTDYKASVRIVYLETDFETLRKRNRSRRKPVDEDAYETLLDRFEMPTPLESQAFEIVASNRAIG